MRDKRFLTPPSNVVRAASGHIPFEGHRTCAQWKQCHPGQREMTDEERLQDARNGSAKLLYAIRRAG